MLTRIQPAARQLALLPRVAGARQMGSFKPETQVCAEARSAMSDIPVPAGSWKEHHGKRNAKWNMQIGATALLLVASCAAAYKAGVWLPHDIKDYRKVKINPT